MYSAGILFFFIAWDLWGFANANGPRGAMWAAGGALSCVAVYYGLLHMLGMWLSGPEMTFAYVGGVIGVLGTWFAMRKVIALVGSPSSPAGEEH